MQNIEEEIELLKLELRIEVAYLEKAQIDIKSDLDLQYAKCINLKNDIEQLKIKRNHLKNQKGEINGKSK